MIPDHPEIRCIERTGYPSWMQEQPEEYEPEYYREDEDERV